jgi:hypothetical protein
MNAKETLELLSKQWATVNDVIKLTGFKKSRAYEIVSGIRLELTNQGYLLPRGLIPMEYVVEKFKINIDYLEKMKKNV